MLALNSYHGHGIDRAKKPAMTLNELNRFLEDMDKQPGWRMRADQEFEYYDGNQLSPKQLADLEDRGLPPVVINLVAPTVNVILGMEAKTRTDWLVRPEREQDRETVEALQQKLKKASNETNAGRACGDAYAKQVKGGIGWVEVSRAHNPLKYPYRVSSVDHREIWWDWRAKEPDLSDARYLVRRKWYDTDQVKQLFPKHADLIGYAMDGWSSWDPTNYQAHQYWSQDNLYERDWGWDESEWRDTVRDRVCLYEVWYRTYERVYILMLPDGRRVEYDRNDPLHVAAVLSGRVKVQGATIPRMNLSWWMGPHRFWDGPSPLPHDEFPYIPFWGYREDTTGIPYGVIRNMRPLQDEVNRRRAKMLWQLSAHRTFVDDDAVDDHDKVMHEVSRPDAYIKVRSDRKNKQWAGIKVEEHQGLNSQQMAAYQDSKQGIQDVSGVYQQMLGDMGNTESGVAIQTLIEQGTTSLAEINDNYRMARQKVGEQLLALIIEDIGENQETVEVPRSGGRGKKDVVLNAPMDEDEKLALYRKKNDVRRVVYSVELDSIQSTATYRTQVFLQMSELIKGLPEQLQAPVLDMVIEASDMPGKDEIAERVRKVTGVVPQDPETMDPQERQAMEQRQKAMQEKEQLEKERVMLELEQMRADLREKHADIFETEADARHKAAETDKTQAETAENWEKARKVAAEADQAEDAAPPDVRPDEYPMPPNRPSSEQGNLEAPGVPMDQARQPDLNPQRNEPRPQPHRETNADQDEPVTFRRR